MDHYEVWRKAEFGIDWSPSGNKVAGPNQYATLSEAIAGLGVRLMIKMKRWQIRGPEGVYFEGDQEEAKAYVQDHSLRTTNTVEPTSIVDEVEQLLDPNPF